MGALGLFVLSLATCLVASVRGNYFFVVAPNMIRFEHPETVLISVLGNQKNVRVWFSHNDHSFSEHNVVVRENTPHQVEMMVRETNLALEERESKPRTILLNAECDGVLRQKEIFLQYSSGYIFVQTSQPIYVPKSTVKIRYLALTESMRKIGRSANVSMDIISPQGQVFSRTHKTDSEAFYRYDFELPSFTEMGIWTIKVYYRGLYQTEARAFFEVREYVVPTFGVDIDVTPETILKGTRGTIIVTVTSKYVYGKPLIGMADIKVNLLEDTKQTELLALPNKPLNAEGKAEFEIPVELLKDEVENKGIEFPDGQRLKVIATATEGATLKKESGIHTGVVFSKVPYKFKFTRSKKYCRPLRKYYLRLDVTLPNGQPAARVPVKVTKIADGRTEEKQGETDANGEITLIFNTEGDAMTFQASDIDERSESDPFTVESYSGENQILAEHIIKDGENQIRAFNNMQNGSSTGLISMIVARGKIMEPHWERPNNEIVKILTHNLQEKISPSGRYIIFYCDKRTNEVVADSIKFTLTPVCKDQGIHLNTDQRVQPGDSKNLQVTGQPGTNVGLSAVDKAVLLLNSKNVLHRNKMFQELDSHDMGCGYGGGRNSAHVFSNAGLTVITNAEMRDTGVRDSASCEGRGRKRRSSDFCEADQRCCDGGELFATSLYEDPDRERVDTVDCYSQVRKLLNEFPDLHIDCLKAFYYSCAEYIDFVNYESGVVTKSGTSDYLDDLSAIKYKEKNIYVRKNFKESFEFEDYQIGVNTGEVNIRLKYPDSITEWMIQAIGVTPGNGVCISEPLNVTAFRDFFCQVDLPYSTKRMEHTNIKATVFYYGDDGPDASVSIYMDGADGLCSNTKPNEKSKKIEFDMTPNSAHTVQFPVIPMVAPKEYPIKLTAILNKLGVGQVDAIEKKLYVINEGEEKLIELQSCLDPMNQLHDCQSSDRITVTHTGGENPTQVLTIDMTLPERIKDTGSGVAFVYSDNAMEDVVQTVVMGGFGKFILLPTGCVEQTITKLAPLVYAMRYLKLTDQVDETIEANGNRFIREGCLREYGFKKPDHSYPPYARTGSSTWLTAFVSKVFCQARKVVDDAISEAVHISPTINWLATHQNGDGSFTEYNYVNHGALMGLSQAGHPALTAFILIAMQECRTRSTNVETAVQKAMAFLEAQNINTLRQDQYALAIVTYALALSNSTRKMIFYENLKEVAGKSAGMMYWGWPGTGSVKPSHIEATSYALLAMLQLDDLRASNATVKWLSLHRSSGGAFGSTQDTVIGLQALSEYNIRVYHTDIDLTVKFMAENYNEKIFKLNKQNALVQKIATDLPVEAGDNLRVEVTGKGTGKLRVDLRYNVEKSPDEECPFNVEVKSKRIEKDRTAIAIGKDKGCDCGICGEEDEETGNEAMNMAFGETEMVEAESNFGRKKRNAEQSKLYCTTLEVTSKIDTAGMVTIEFGLETEMTVLEEDLEILVNNELISMYELPTNGKGFFVLYIDRMYAGETYKFAFTLEDKAIEGLYNRQSALVKVVDYYNPGASCTAFYGTGSNLEPNYKAECNMDACRCLISSCPSPWKEKLKRKTQPALFLIHRTCNRHYADYAVQVKILTVTTGDIKRKETMAKAEVKAVYNQGKERLVAGSDMFLYWRMDCDWPQFKIGTKYYIIAKDGFPYRDGEGDKKKFKYYIRDGDVVVQWKPKYTPVGRFMTGYENYWKDRQCPK